MSLDLLVSFLFQRERSRSPIRGGRGGEFIYKQSPAHTHITLQPSPAYIRGVRKVVVACKGRKLSIRCRMGGFLTSCGHHIDTCWGVATTVNKFVHHVVTCHPRKSHHFMCIYCRAPNLYKIMLFEDWPLTTKI